MENSPRIVVGTILVGKESEMRVTSVVIHKNNQGKWDALVKAEFLDPRFEGIKLRFP
jgi:hypothetical protein